MIRFFKHLKRFGKHMNISPPGIRLQLALWYTVVSATLMLLFGIAFYSSLQQTLASSFDSSLRLRAQQIAEEVSVKDGRLTVDNILDELPELDATAAIVDHIDKESLASLPETATSSSDEQHSNLPALLVRVLDVHGHIIFS